MARSGHGRALEERRLGHGLQTLPSGLSAFPVARTSEFHRSINQKLPELWSDFSDRGSPDPRVHCEQSTRFHGDTGDLNAATRGSPWLEQDIARLRADVEQRRDAFRERLRRCRLEGGFAGEDKEQQWALRRFNEEREEIRREEEKLKQLESHPGNAGRRRVLFVGFAEFDMDGRVHTAGEMDRLMLHAASAKFPCARPASFDEYSDGSVLGLPAKNLSGRDAVFAGPGATGCELNHTNTLGAQKAMVPAGDPLDGSWGAASLYGRKSVICVLPMERVKRQQSLMQFGLARESVGKSGRLRRAGSLSCLTDQTQWASGDFGAAGSTNQSQRMIRTDQFFR